MGIYLSRAKDHQREILISAAVLVTGGLTIFTISKLRNRSTLVIKEPVENVLKFIQRYKQSSWLDHSTQEDLAYKNSCVDSITQSIQVKYFQNSEFLDPSTIVQILENSIDLASNDYVATTLRNREIRRKAKKAKNIQQYQQLILNYNEELENILEKAQTDLLVRLDIPKEVYEHSVVMLMESGYFQELYMLQASVKQKIKERVPSKKNLTKEQVKEIIMYNLVLLKNPPQIFNLVLPEFQKSEELSTLMPMALSALLQDIIYEKYGVEEEDQIRTLQKQGLSLYLSNFIEYQMDIEIQQLLGEMENVMMEFMKSLGFGGIEQVPESLDELV